MLGDCMDLWQTANVGTDSMKMTVQKELCGNRFELSSSQFNLLSKMVWNWTRNVRDQDGRSWMDVSNLGLFEMALLFYL